MAWAGSSEAGAGRQVDCGTGMELQAPTARPGALAGEDKPGVDGPGGQGEAEPKAVFWLHDINLKVGLDCQLLSCKGLLWARVGPGVGGDRGCDAGITACEATPGSEPFRASPCAFGLAGQARISIRIPPPHLGRWRPASSSASLAGWVKASHPLSKPFWARWKSRTVQSRWAVLPFAYLFGRERGEGFVPGPMALG